MSGKMESTLFAVDEEPYCLWEYDTGERNLACLKGIDSQYFSFIAASNYALFVDEQSKNLIDGELSGDNLQRAALAMRTAYHHGLETFFTLVCAGIQAPLCVHAWILLSAPQVVL